MTAQCSIQRLIQIYILYRIWSASARVGPYLLLYIRRSYDQGVTTLAVRALLLTGSGRRVDTKNVGAHRSRAGISWWTIKLWDMMVKVNLVKLIWLISQFNYVLNPTARIAMFTVFCCSLNGLHLHALVLEFLQIHSFIHREMAWECHVFIFCPWFPGDKSALFDSLAFL